MRMRATSKPPPPPGGVEVGAETSVLVPDPPTQFSTLVGFRVFLSPPAPLSKGELLPHRNLWMDTENKRDLQKNKIKQTTIAIEAPSYYSIIITE